MRVSIITNEGLSISWAVVAYGKARNGLLDALGKLDLSGLEAALKEFEKNMSNDKMNKDDRDLFAVAKSRIESLSKSMSRA